MFFVKLFYGILLLSAGIATIKYRKHIYDWTGRWGWAERYLGNGGTVIAITMSGMAMIFLSIAYPAGVFEKDEQSSGDQKVQQWSTSKNQEAPKSNTETENSNNQ